MNALICFPQYTFKHNRNFLSGHVRSSARNLSKFNFDENSIPDIIIYTRIKMKDTNNVWKLMSILSSGLIN
jgi:hypothetical protein